MPSLAQSDELAVVKTGFHARINERVGRILSRSAPGHSTHVALVPVAYDSGVRRSAAMPPQLPGAPLRRQ